MRERVTVFSLYVCLSVRLSVCLSVSLSFCYTTVDLKNSDLLKEASKFCTGQFKELFDLNFFFF